MNTIPLSEIRHIPNIFIGEFKTALYEMKNNRSPGDDSIAVESIK